VLSDFHFQLSAFHFQLLDESIILAVMKHILVCFFSVLQLSSFAQSSSNLDSLFNWQDTSLVASAAHGNTYNEIWGYAKEGKEYAIIGTTGGTHIFDVTVAENSEQVEFIEGALTGAAVIHRDFHDYNNHLYMVCDEGSSTLQIADLRFLPDSAPVVYDSNALFSRSHNIFIDTASARMYVCGGASLFAIYSLEDPIAPTLILNASVAVNFWSQIGYVHDVFVRGDTAYLNAGDGLFIVDFSNILNPQMIGLLDNYVQQGYNHSGWLMPNAPYYAFIDETHGTDVKIVDVSDMNDLQITDTIGSNVSQLSIAHNLIYRDNLLFVSYYFDGLYIFDCSNPANPELAGYFDTSTEIPQNGVYRGCWGVYPFFPSGNILVSDMQTGLWVLGTSLVQGVDDSFERQTAFSVYPNPTLSSININENFMGDDYRIVDMLGTEVASGKLVSVSLDVSTFSNGMYALVVLSEGHLLVSRFVKQ